MTNALEQAHKIKEIRKQYEEAETKEERIRLARLLEANNKTNEGTDREVCRQEGNN